MRYLASVQDVLGNITPPAAAAPYTAGNGAAGLSNFISNVITLIYMVAAVTFVLLIIFGAFQWMTSGGEKEAIAKARNRITYAIIGIVLLALTFVILNAIGGILNFHFFGGQFIPLGSPTGSNVCTQEVIDACHSNGGTCQVVNGIVGCQY